MKREDKNILIKHLAEEINDYDHFYVADNAGMNAQDTTDLRRKCFEKDVKLTVVKNTLFKIALEQADGDFQELYSVLSNNSSVLFANTANAPGKLIKEFQKDHDLPILKGAFASGSIYIGADQLDALASLKSREELIGDIIVMLQSPVQTVLSQLQSGGQIISGVVKTLADRN